MNETRTYSDTGNAKPNLQDYSVSEISAALKKTVEDRFGYVRVRGEITGFRGQHSSGHCYFALKDDRARIEAVIWKGVYSRLKHKPEEGLEVVASGKLTTYPGSSKYQIVIENLEPAGAGALMALLEERKKKLEAEGLFAPERKQLLPFMPKRIGVVTSPTGSVIRDILHRIGDRYPLHVQVWPVRVQGETTGQEVSNGITGFNAMPEEMRPDVIIVARGGGSIEDLWGFNDEAVVRAAAASHIPLISAVGHETDWTLIDYAADVRAPTPTGAAELAVPVKADLEAKIAAYRARLKSALIRKIDKAKADLKAAMRGLATPDSLLALPRRRLDEASGRLSRGLEFASRNKRASFEAVAARLSPSGLTRLIAQQNNSILSLGDRSTRAMANNLLTKRTRFDNAASRLSPRTIVQHSSQASQRLEGLSRRQNSAFEANLFRLKSGMEQSSRMLDSLSYKSVLNRGYAVVRDANKKPISSSTAIKSGVSFSVEFKDGDLDAVAAGTAKQAAPKTSKAKSKPSTTENQGDLF